MTTIPDPRPVVVEYAGVELVSAWRCSACRHPSLWASPRCPACGGPFEPAHFGPGGTVWSSTVVRVPIPGRTPPYGLAYVDLDDGPRLLAHVETDVRLAPGTRVAVVGASSEGDVVVGVA